LTDLVAEDAALQTIDAEAYSALPLLMLECPEMSAGPTGNAEISGLFSISRDNTEYARASGVCRAASSASRCPDMLAGPTGIIVSQALHDRLEHGSIAEVCHAVPEKQ